MSTGIWKTSPRPRRPAGDAPGLCGTLTCAISSSSSDGPGWGRTRSGSQQGQARPAREGHQVGMGGVREGRDL